MVRNYQKKKPTLLQYSEDDMARALLDIQDGMSVRQAAIKYNIPRATIQARLKGRSQSPRKIGKKPALLRNEEMDLALNLATLADFGLAFDIEQLQVFVQYYLNNAGRKIALFNDNKPGIEWVRAFLNRQKDILTKRTCQNISRKRAAVSEEIVTEYFQQLKTTLNNVPPENIINYDETNLVDDPKGKVQIFRRGAKHAERILNTSKTTTSIMYAVTATGKCLAPYVIYRAERMQDSYLLGGPGDARYGRTSTGWFDSDSFNDWFKSVYLHYIRNLPKEEPKVLIGDNLPSHINMKVIQQCIDNNVRMCFLPPNSTHLLQPLDVSIFAPLKKEWNKILTNWKLGEGKHYTVLPKHTFPSLLLNLMQSMDDKWKPLAKAGFKSCGIYPFNPEAVLVKIRRPTQHPTSVSPLMISYLKEQRETIAPMKKRRGRFVNLKAGHSIALEDIMDASTSSQPPVKKLNFESVDTNINRDSDSVCSYKQGDYVLIEFIPSVYYVAKLIARVDNEWKIQYYRKAETSNKLGKDYLGFKLPNVPDENTLNEQSFVLKCKVEEIVKNKIYFQKSLFGNKNIR